MWVPKFRALVVCVRAFSFSVWDVWAPCWAPQLPGCLRA